MPYVGKVSKARRLADGWRRPRLSKAVSSNNGEGCSWDYDRYGNRWHQNAYSGTCPAPQFSFSGSNNRIDTLGQTYKYDAVGNLLNDGFHTYQYDAENRIVSANPGATTYVYDAEGRRFSKTTGGVTEGTVYDRQGRPILRSNDFGPRELYAGGMHLGTYIVNPAHTDTIFYYDHSDWLGTERARTDLTGTPCETIASLPFGDNQTITGTCGDLSALHFTGKERDSESGLDNFEARYFGSSLGRFMSPDPEQIDGFDHLSNPQSWNGYAYVHNNPLNATDPDGLDCIYIDNDSGKMTGFNSGDCDNSTEEKANSGYYVNGTVDTITENQQGQVTGFGGTGENGNLITGAFAPTPLDEGDTHPGLPVLQQPVLGNAAGTVDLLARMEYRAAAFFFPFTGLLIDQVSGIDSGSGVSAAGISRKPGTLGMRGGTDALRRENKVARDIIKELKLSGKDADAVHDIIAGAAIQEGRKLTYKECITVVKEALGLL